MLPRNLCSVGVWIEVKTVSEYDRKLFPFLLGH